MAIREPDQKVWDRFWSSKKDVKKVYPASPSVLKAVLSQLDVRGMKILEVGAGTGRDSLEMARLGADVTILDFSSESLKLVRRQLDAQEGGHLVKLVRGDAFGSPFPDESFDLVFHQGLLEHFVSPMGLLRENYRLIKKGGYCLCDIPQTYHLYTVIKKILIALDKWFAGWETQYTMPQLESMMQDAGFSTYYKYGDWMRPSLVYRLMREVSFKLGIELPMYPLQGSLYQVWKDKVLDQLQDHPLAHWTQLSIGVIGRK